VILSVWIPQRLPNCVVSSLINASAAVRNALAATKPHYKVTSFLGRLYRTVLRKRRGSPEPRRLVASSQQSG
jgi:hypothetical protein